MKKEVMDEWCHKSIKCAIRKVFPECHLEHFCGYVKVPEIVDLDEIQIRPPHGGITYSGDGQNIGLEEGSWIGFDTAHIGDINEPGASYFIERTDDFSRTWDREKIKEEVNQLAEELLEFVPPVVLAVREALEE